MHGSSFLSAPGCSPCHLIFSFSSSSSYLPWNIKACLEMQAAQIQRKMGQDLRKRTVESQSAMSPAPKQSCNTAIAADRCLLLTDLHLWNSYYWLPTHLFSDSLPFFLIYLALKETTTHPSYNLNPIYHMISSSVLPLHPHKCFFKVSVPPLSTALSCPTCRVSSCTSKVQDYLESQQMHYHLWIPAWSFSTTSRTSFIWNSVYKLSQLWICVVALPYLNLVPC